jgi:16S rRNA (cytidine1402-2'-O)-methyltransferase
MLFHDKPKVKIPESQQAGSISCPAFHESSHSIISSVALKVILCKFDKTLILKGQVYLIPVTLGGENYCDVIPPKAINIARSLRYFVVENIRTARRFLRQVDRSFPIDEAVFHELNEHTLEADLGHFLDPAINGHDMGLMSEAGLPGIADPGARLILSAHEKKIRVTPLAGPSSIVMALISSGLNGQNFTFNGYLPVKPRDRAVRIRELEKMAASGFSQLFIETPYRSQDMIKTILASCRDSTLLCVAADITLPSEKILTMPVSEWKKNIPNLDKRMVVFVLQ